MSAACRVEGCPSLVHGRGLCGAHIRRERLYGDPLRLCIDPPLRRGEEHWYWKGEQVGYGAALARLRNARGKASDYPCRDCSAPAFRWVLVGQATREDSRGRTYSLDHDDYAPLCARCHRIGKNAA